MNPPENTDQYEPNESTRPTVPDHEIIRIIGSGSSGRVWLKKNALGTLRAVKVVRANAFRHRRPFEREFNGVLKFEPISRSHEGLVDILQVGFNETESYFYCVMELADDITMMQQITPDNYQPRTLAARTTKRLPVAECVRLGAALTSALGFLHKHGLTHRDIKPSNIIFINGIPKLADIGLVTDVHDDESFVGTDGFIPPEGSGSAQADIYSLGKVLYEIGTGNDRNSYPELPIHLESSKEQDDLVELNKIILKACRSNPRQRYTSADDMLLAFLDFQFNARQTRKKRRVKRLSTIVGIAGWIIGFVFVWFLVNRLLHLIQSVG